MNEILNKLLLAADKFMPEIYFKHLVSTYCACSPFTKKKKTQIESRIKKVVKKEINNYMLSGKIMKNRLIAG